MIRVVLADDHALIREGLCKILALEPDIRVVGEAADAEASIELAARHRPDIVLMDINMPKGGGVAATRALREQDPRVRVIVLTIHDDDEYVRAVLSAGARGYILKDVDPPRIAEAIRQVHAGELFLPKAMMERALSRLQDQPDLGRLSEREHEILQLIAAGRSNREIGQELFITEKTVKNHVTRLLRKLHLQDRTQAAVFAVRHHLLAGDPPLLGPKSQRKM